MVPGSALAENRRECKELGECVLLLGRARALRVLIRSARLGKIAAPCSHNELRTLLAVGLHVNYPETALTGQICGVIPNGVLVADIACHVGGNRVYFLQRPWKVRHAASVVGDGLQSVMSALVLALVCVIE